jgi:hypothetical protein
MTNLPAPIAGFERLNMREVEFNETLALTAGTKENFKLRSIVYSEVNVEVGGKQTDIVIGSSACVKSVTNPECWFIYDPYGPINQDVGNRFAVLQGAWNATDPAANVQILGKTKGTIFIYASESDIDSKREMSL